MNTLTDIGSVRSGVIGRPGLSLVRREYRQGRSICQDVSHTLGRWFIPLPGRCPSGAGLADVT